MTTAQKVIKYLAIAFAIFLIVGIISSIIAIGSGITSFLSKEESAKTEIKELKDDSKILSINLVASNLEIKKGEKLKIEKSGNGITLKEEDNKIYIEEKTKKWKFNKDISKVILYLPEEAVFNEVKIETGAGKLNIEIIKSEKIELRLGAGKTVINDITSNNTKIETGAGELIIKNGKLNDSKIEVGVGKLEIVSEFTGNTKIETGIGSNNIKLLPTEDNYKIEFKKGLGSIKYNGENIPDDYIVGEGKNFIRIEGGIGSINVTK